MEFFEKNQVRSSPDYAVMKSREIVGEIARTFLATIHGYVNDLEVCEDSIELYNKNPSLSEPGHTHWDLFMLTIE